ncbi:MAG: P-II family nitrogen regulator [Thermoanaerobaculia bacterium]
MDALEVLPGVGGITALDVRGFGHQRGWSGVEHRATGSLNYVEKTMLLVVVDDDRVDDVLATIHRHAHTGNVGDGKVFVSTVDDALRVRTGDRGVRAL